jgi:4-amino-4-deoxy-L-arabinose transferase-like glycosyltransferase
MKNKIITFSLFAIILFSSFFFGFHRLSDFSGVDEPYWSYDRVPNFWKAIENRKWKSTNICDKPGIPLAIISGTGLPFIDGNPKDLKSLRYEAKTPQQFQEITNLYFHLRLPVFLFTLAMLPVFFFLIRKLLGTETARFALIFIGLSPILLGISLIINSDSILWILTALSTLSLFVFFKGNERKYLLLSGFFLGLSVITKYVANVLFVYFFLVFLLEYVLFAHKTIGIGEYLKKALLNYLILFLVAIATAFVFFPATWVKLSVLVHATIGNPVFASTWPLFVGIIGLLALDVLFFKAKFSGLLSNFFIKHKHWFVKAVGLIFLFLVLVVFLHVFLKVNVFDIQGLISSPKGIGQDLNTNDAEIDEIVTSSKGTSLLSTLPKYLGAILADTYSLIFSVSPIILLAILFAIVSIVRKKDLERNSITAVYILIFILIFYLGSTVNNVITTVRYQIMTYPLTFVLAAIGISEFMKIEKVGKYIKPPLAYLILIVILLSSLFFVKPDYLAYASEILPNNFLVNLKGMGEGSFEAANYLNSLPGAHDMNIWADKGAVCERFLGNCSIDFKRNTFEQKKFDYFVVSTDRESRTLKLSASIRKLANFPKAYEDENPVFEVMIDKNPNNFVKVLRGEDIQKITQQ